jgi:hypothetical protein
VLAHQRLPVSPRKYTINCHTCGKGLKSIDFDFAKDHLVDNPTHLEYRVVVVLLYGCLRKRLLNTLMDKNDTDEQSKRQR